MTRKFFGTDGIRGTTNLEPMTAETALRVGQAAGAHFLRGDHRHRVVIGKDTRLSGYMMELAMVAGFTSVGMDVVLLGPMPTPAVAMLTRSMRADLGVDDLRLAQSFRRQWHQAVRARRLQAQRRRRARDREQAREGAQARQVGTDRPRPPDRRCPRPLHPFRQVDLSRASATRRAQGRRSIAPMAPLIMSRPKPCGSSAPR